eukprot:352099-Chlamydomonas_euryale.AAC.2
MVWGVERGRGRWCGGWKEAGEDGVGVTVCAVLGGWEGGRELPVVIVGVALLYSGSVVAAVVFWFRSGSQRDIPKRYPASVSERQIKIVRQVDFTPVVEAHNKGVVCKREDVALVIHALHHVLAYEVLLLHHLRNRSWSSSLLVARPPLLHKCGFAHRNAPAAQVWIRPPQRRCCTSVDSPAATPPLVEYVRLVLASGCARLYCDNASATVFYTRDAGSSCQGRPPPRTGNTGSRCNIPSPPPYT